MSREKIAAVVVTYNRKQYLIKVLTALLNQTLSIDKILLIDNASTDGTSELLKENGYLSNAKFEYIKLKKNTGGAGGFYEGIKRGYEAEYDWLWLMDDDVVPEKDCLEKMLTLKHISKVIHPSRKNIEGTHICWEQFFDIRVLDLVDLWDKGIKEKDYTFVNTICFEGVLIHRDIIQKAGLPYKDFFIFYDDTEYGYRVSLYENIIYTRSAYMTRLLAPDLNKFKKFGIVRTPIEQYWKHKYCIRNKFIMYKMYKKEATFFKLYFSYEIIRRVLLIIFLDNHKIKRLSTLYRGIQEGLNHSIDFKSMKI